MESCLREHDAKKGPQGWKYMGKTHLTNIGVYEAKDLHFAVLGDASSEALFRKAGAVGNMAMMVADVTGTLPLKEAVAEIARITHLDPACAEDAAALVDRVYGDDDDDDDDLIASMMGKCEGTD
jgi:hypothetical protein